MNHLPTTNHQARVARAATAALVLLFAAGAGAQGAATAAEREGQATGGSTGAATTDAKHGSGMHEAGFSKGARPKREGDLGRAPFGTGSRRHDASAAGTPSAKPKGEPGGTAGTR